MADMSDLTPVGRWITVLKDRRSKADWHGPWKNQILSNEQPVFVSELKLETDFGECADFHIMAVVVAPDGKVSLKKQLRIRQSCPDGG